MGGAKIGGHNANAYPAIPPDRNDYAEERANMVAGPSEFVWCVEVRGAPRGACYRPSLFRAPSYTCTQVDGLAGSG